VYSLFGGKDGLCGALYRAVFQELRARVLALPETADPSADLVRAGVEGFRPLALTRPQLFRLAFEWPARRSATTEADHREAQATFDALMRVVDRAAGGRMPDMQLRRMAYGFHALCQGLASGELAGVPVPGMDMSQLWRDSLTAYVKGFAAADPTKLGPSRRKNEAA
jgi:AcrR family transcriptional regulator